MPKTYLYHLTYPYNVSNIKKKGLILNPPKRNWSGTHAPLKNRTYLCCHPQFAGGDISAVFLIHQLNKEKLLMDEDTIWPYWEIEWKSVKKEFITPGEKARAWLTRIIDNMGFCGALASLALNGTCAYGGAILPEHITLQKGNADSYISKTYYGNIALHAARNESLKKYAKPHFSMRGSIDVSEIVNDVISLLRTSLDPIADLMNLEKQRIGLK